MSGAGQSSRTQSPIEAVQLRRVAGLQLVLLAGLVLGAIWISPPGIFSDSVSGFYVMFSMEHGAPWNHRLVVDEADIARDRSEFTSWWTPGQYLVPMLFRPLGLDLGQCMIATTILAWLAGLAGYRKLFLELGVPDAYTWPSLAMLASQPYVLDWASFYHGGELLQWSYFPWCALILLRRRQLHWRELPLVAGALILGLGLKSSFAIPAAALLSALALMQLSRAFAQDRSAATKQLVSWLARALVVTLVTGLAFIAYVSAGRSPASDAAGAPGLLLREVLFAASAPVSSLFDLWRLFIPESEETVWPFGEITPQLSLAALASLALLYALLRRLEIGRDYKILLASGYLVFVLAYALAHALEMAISLNVRHYRLAGVLFVPGLITAVAELGRPALRRLLAVGLAAACVAMAVGFARSVAQPRSERVVGREGFSQIYASRELIELLHELDAELASGNNLIGVPWPQLGFEIERNRVLDMRTAVEGPAYFEQKAWRGRADNVVILLPTDDVRSGKSKPVIAAFKDQGGWKRIHRAVDDYWILHSGSHQGFPR